MACRALAVAEGELQRAGEQIAEYQNVNRDLVAQADDSKQHLQVKLHRSASCSCCCLCTQHNTDMQYVMTMHTIISWLANACAPYHVLRNCTTQACEGECNALRDECRAISEDLEVLVKENQVVNHQLTTAVTERCAADQRVLLLVYIMHDVSTEHIACMDLKFDCITGQHV